MELTGCCFALDVPPYLVDGDERRSGHRHLG